jgi:hypothetical protein
MKPHIQILQENEHTHEADDDMIGENEALNQMKDAIREDPTIPIKRVYNKVARAMNQGGGDREHTLEFHRIRTSMTRTRLELVPAVPHTVDDITIEDTWTISFCTRTMTVGHPCIHHRQKSNMPAKMPGGIHGRHHLRIDSTLVYRNRVICLVNVLMTGQLIGQYRQTLQVVKQNVRRISRHRWRPHLVSDYEQSPIAAVEIELPNSRISGCYFHFGQNY